MAEIDVSYDDWHAIHDHMGKTLHVHGKCEVPGGGFAVGIEARPDQGINPEVLMLNFRITPTGESPSHQTVDWHRPWNDDGVQYTTVDFLVAGGVEAPSPPTLEIEDVH